MLEKLFDNLPDWVKSKVAIRVVYTVGSFVTARVVAFLTGDYLNGIAGVIVNQAGKVGIVLQFKIVSVDQRMMEAFITGLLMLGAEFLIEHLHMNYVLPAVEASKADAPPPVGKV